MSLVILHGKHCQSLCFLLVRCQAGDEAGYSMDLPCGTCSPPNCATEKEESRTSTWPKETVVFAIVLATFDSAIYFWCVCVSTYRNKL